MAKIFNAPSELALPGFDWEDTKTYHKECDQYLEDLKQRLTVSAVFASPNLN